MPERIEGNEYAGHDPQLQAQQAAAQPAAAPVDRMAKIKELGEMRSQGLLTDEEFAAEKARILALKEASLRPVLCGITPVPCGCPWISRAVRP